VPVGNDASEWGFIPTIVADMALLLIILSGLSVLRRNGGGTFGLTRLLWTQVRWRFSLALLCLIFFFFILKGVIWLVLGFAVEIPTLVSPASLSFVPFFCLYPICIAGVYFIPYEW
jgi:hypothetical protein